MEQSMIEVYPQLMKLAQDCGIVNFKFKSAASVSYSRKKVEENSSVSITGGFEPEKSEGKNKFEEEAQKILSEKKVAAEIELEASYKGKKWPSGFKAIPLFKTPEDPVEILAKPGEVTLFDFWATWCGPCQRPMTHNQEMLEKHPEWEGKVRIVGLSLDDAKANPVKRVTEKSWTKVEHYILESNWKNPLCKHFDIHGIPFCVLVDKNGVVQLTGHPMNMKLDQSIPKLINDETLEGDASTKDTSYPLEKAKADLETFCKTYEKDLDSLTFPYISIEYTKEVKEGKCEVTDTSMKARCSWTKKRKPIADQIKIEIEKVFSGKLKFEFGGEEIPTCSVEYGSKCNKCGKALGVCDQYLCIICKPEVYFCPDCVDSYKDPKSPADLIHPHGLFFIQKDSQEKIDEITFQNLKMVDPYSREHPRVKCNCCENSIVGTRWKCAVCKDFDMCDACLGICSDPAHAKYAELMKKATDAKHEVKGHVYIREDFNNFVDWYAE